MRRWVFAGALAFTVAAIPVVAMAGPDKKSSFPDAAKTAPAVGEPLSAAAALSSLPAGAESRALAELLAGRPGAKVCFNPDGTATVSISQPPPPGAQILPGPIDALPARPC